ncbi:uncharacterized protein N7518_005517 [Penicillium psychrosexuale]|uniref:uncharacterized protein n=1 Tax=Penicillium psychrosexuale TaxID=1002107 RepID=UPI0025451408|nr:uncharacterized protein N7518_005517 [Penicillium psychrosexuale]KAJ5796977.1 hypothetical protein N7518_005517 [Penicillium psychrosexuale]
MTLPSETLAVQWDFAIIPSDLSKTVKPPRFGAFTVGVVDYRVKIPYRKIEDPSDHHQLL